MFDVSDVVRTVLLCTGSSRDLRFGDLIIRCDKDGVCFSNLSFPRMYWKDFTFRSVIAHMDMFHHIYNMPCALLIGMEQYYEELFLNRDRDVQSIRGTSCSDISKIDFKYGGREFVATAYREKAMIDLLCINHPLIPTLPSLKDHSVRMARLNIRDGQLYVKPYREGDGMVVIYRTDSGTTGRETMPMVDLLGLNAYSSADRLERESTSVDLPNSPLETWDVKHKHVFAIIGDDRSRELRYTTLIGALSAMDPMAPDKLEELLAAMEKEGM